MRKISNIVLTLCVLILTLVLSGCGNNDKIKIGLFMSKAEKLKTSLVPVYQHMNDSSFWEHPSECPVIKSNYYAVRDASGQFEQFDNDGDYEEYAEIVDMVYNITCFGFNPYGDHIYNYFGRDFYDKYETDQNIFNEQFLKANKDHISLIEGVAEYLYGDKSKIDNEELYSCIEEYYINQKPNEWVFEFSEYYNKYSEFYNHGRVKQYRANANSKYVHNLYYGINVFSAGQNKFYLADNTPVPKGSLIIEALCEQKNN